MLHVLLHNPVYCNPLVYCLLGFQAFCTFYPFLLFLYFTSWYLPPFGSIIPVTLSLHLIWSDQPRDAMIQRWLLYSFTHNRPLYLIPYTEKIRDRLSPLVILKKCLLRDAEKFQAMYDL